jgi:uncharacterized protein
MVETFDPAALRRAMILFLEGLREHRAEIDSLNVYPVPDGDTGTNMALTQQAVVDVLAGTDAEGGGFSSLGDDIARASLLGARGNSGVILSQILRGIAERLPAEHEATGWDLAAALEHAAHEAYAAVAKPVEGSMLSVVRAAGQAAASAATQGAGAPPVAHAALVAARSALEQTRERNPILARAGVVDAGGKGILLLLDALSAALTGSPLSEPAGSFGPVGSATGSAEGAVDQTGPAYEVQYLFEGDEAGVDRLRGALASIGESLVVVGGGSLYNVHVHTDHPGRAVEAALGLGSIRSTSIASLDARVDSCMAGQARGVRIDERREVTSLVVVAEGDGLTRTLRSLGATIVQGGAGNNPAVADIVAAIGGASGASVAVVPGHPNVVPAAERAAVLSSKPARAIAAVSVPAAIAAATAFSPDASLDENAASMGEAAAACRSGEVVRAERDATTPQGPVHRGDWLGMVDGESVAAGADPMPVLSSVARALAAETSEVLTVVFGAGMSAADGAMASELLRREHPSMRVDVVDGGQPRSSFIVGAE